jgi:hypothetical protein
MAGSRERQLISNCREFVNRADKDSVAFKAGRYWKGKLTALSEQEKEHVMNENKPYPSNGRAVSRLDPKLPEFSTERREEMVSANLAIPDLGKGLSIEKPIEEHDILIGDLLWRVGELERRLLHPSIEKPIAYRKGRKGSSDNIRPLFPPEEKKAKVQPLKEEVDKTIIFSDEHSRFAWEISQAVDRVVATMPPEAEDRDPKFQRITFSTKHRNSGIHAIFYTGTVIPTGKKNVLIVPERTIKVLNTLGIQYRVVQDK